MASPPPFKFKRIRLMTRDDFTSSYGLIAFFLQHPGAAESIQEFIIDPPVWGSFGDPFPPLPPTPAHLVALKVDPTACPLIRDHATSLGLGVTHTQALLTALHKKEEELFPRQTEEGGAEAQRKARRFGGSMANRDKIDYILAAATVLISLCPNITSLRINGIHPQTVLGEFLTRNNYGELPGRFLTKLQKVLVHGYQSHDERNYSHLLSMHCFRFFHRLPAVDTFSFDALENYQELDAFFPPKVSPGIKKIVIAHSKLSDYLIYNMIRIPVALEEFSHTDSFALWGAKSDSVETIYPKTLGKCLLEHKDSLRVLHITAHGCATPAEDSSVDEYKRSTHEIEAWEAGEQGKGPLSDEVNSRYFLNDKTESPKDLPFFVDEIPTTREYAWNSIGSLHDFTNLTHLSIRLGLLLGYYVPLRPETRYRPVPPVPSSGPQPRETYIYTPSPSVSYRLVDCLPPNVEYLKLYGYERGKYPVIDSHVDEFLNKKSELFPRLREIEDIDEHVPGEYPAYSLYSDKWTGRMPEDKLWKRPTDGLDWGDA